MKEINYSFNEINKDLRKLSVEDLLINCNVKVFCVEILFYAVSSWKQFYIEAK